MSFFSPIKPPNLGDSGNRQIWAALEGAAAALAIITAAKQAKLPALVITASSTDAHRLLSELRFFNSNDSRFPILHLTDWETLPYDNFSPHDDIVSERLETLYHLTHLRTGLVVVPITTLMGRLPPVDYLNRYSLIISTGDQLNPHAIRQQLEQCGYRCVNTVYEHGEFALRGSLIDVFPMGSDLPLRIDLFDDCVESLRTFDPETQRSIQKIEHIRLLPAKEFPLDKEGIQQFQLAWHEQFDVDHRRCPIYRDITAGFAPAGIEYYLPLFFDQCVSLFDYLPKNTQLFTYDSIEESGNQYWQQIQTRYQSRSGDIERPILSPEALFLNLDEVFSSLKCFRRCHLSSDKSNAHIVFNSQTIPHIAIDNSLKTPFRGLQQFLLETEHRVLFCAESAGRREVLMESLESLNIRPQVVDNWSTFINSNEHLAITEHAIDNSLYIDEPKVIVITETQLFGDQVQQRRRRSSKESNEPIIKNLTELKIGAPVVHIDHGVGRYRGLQPFDIDGQNNEFLTLEYEDNAKLYVPVTHLHLISRYSGSDQDSAPLHKLGSKKWQQAKDKAAQEMRDAAAELLDIYARREIKEGFAYPNDLSDYQRFAAGFPFEETPDQTDAITSVLDDMLSTKAMDRLVCGDVGFGKTEVAMRATFIAANAGKQVAILVPTTLLAQQHYQSFKDRFAGWPVNIEVISRFRKNKQIEAIQQEIANGKVDIVIGTHKLLQSEMPFKSLGLLIIDEEHRFGVRQKEAIKSLRSEVDILTLTATPIPRTLHMAMNGIRDLSIISTPPARRLSIKTFVSQRDDNLIKEAISREILRGGQVYFLHNDVKSIDKTATELGALIPGARINIAHGQLRERELEQVMSDFYHRRFNILVCSTIIETGIDVPNANTIIIERADKFGLAQLHQLRGRVGRSHHQAYAYLFTPNPKVMSKDAIKRLEVIENTDELGAGFTLATHDLEIRGAGELLGDGQSGKIHTIGFSLYMDMLEETVKAIRAGKSAEEITIVKDSIDVNLHIPALIPNDYLPDVHLRLIFYKRLASVTDFASLEELKVEIIDRFGTLPESVNYLLRVTQLKIRAEQIGITKIEANSHRGKLVFSSTPSIDPMTIVKIVQNQSQKYQLQGADQLVFTQSMASAEERLQAVESLFDRLTSTSKAA